MQFWKMNGAGNDFIVINNMIEKIPQELFPDIAQVICERHLSVGADGFMVVEAPEGDGDYRMIFFNSDGSLGEMCGNGARCISRYGYENHLAGDIQKVETTAGIVTGQRLSDSLYKVRLNDPTTVMLEETLDVDGVECKCSYVELGNPGLPHGVVGIQGLKDYPTDKLFELGRKLRYHSFFPKGANINFYEIIGPNHVYERTYERGVEDFTYACGTGTGSTVLVLTQLGLVDGKNVQVDMAGGTLYIDLTEPRVEGTPCGDIFLTGPTNIVAKGELTDENLKALLNQ